MASEIGALAVRVTADIGDFVDRIGRVDRDLAKLSKKVDKHAQNFLKFGAAAASAGAAMLALSKHAADTVDQIGKLSEKVGVSVEALSGLKYAAQLSDVSVEQLGQGLKQLNKFMDENNVRGVSTEEQLLKIADAFAAAPDGARKTALAMEYFGKAGADLIPFLNQGRAGIEELRKEAEKLGLVFSGDQAKQMAEFNDSLTKMKSVATGLAIEISGPLVKAITAAATEFINARKNGEAFFDSILQGYRRLVTGSDADKFAREMEDAYTRAVEAGAQAERLSKIGGQAAARGYAKARQELRNALTDVARLEAIQKQMASEYNFENPLNMGPHKPGALGSGKDGANQQAIDEIIAEHKAMVEREKEVREIMHQVRIQEDARELAQIQLQNEERARLRELAAQQELEFEEFMLQERDRIRREDHEADRYRLEQEKQLRQERLRAAQQGLNNMASLMNTSSRRTFEVGKAFAIAEAIVKTTLATIEAFEWGMKLGGPPLAAAFAAAAAASGINMVNNLRQQKFGGGGGAPTPAGQGSSGISAPVADAGAGGSGGGRRGPDTIIHLNGQFFGRDQVRELLSMASEEVRDGGRLVIA